ncbi:MAG: HD domain-containing protein [Granulosicoccus sp.]
MNTPDPDHSVAAATEPTSADAGASASDWKDSLDQRLRQQLEFLMAIDALKGILRANRIVTGERKENSAEHSWHLAMFASVLAEHANEPVDVNRVVLMLLLHDIVEIDAGDEPLHGTKNPNRPAMEAAAAERLFGLLPNDQGSKMLALWHEFEAQESADSQFAHTLDRLQPIMLNQLTDGGTWADYEVSLSQVKKRTCHIEAGSSTLWQTAERIFGNAVERGYLSGK